MNFNCCVLDVAEVTIGERTMFGPFVQVYTATHPVDGNARKSRIEYALPISIGRYSWIGGGAIICPGVKIGENCVVAAGAVVTKNISPNSVVGGNPARVIRTIPPLKD
jgi:maltose O-acetyltransferase